MFAILDNEKCLHILDKNTVDEAMKEFDPKVCRVVLQFDSIKSDVRIDITGTVEKIKNILNSTLGKSISLFSPEEEVELDDEISEELVDSGYCSDFYYKDGTSFEGYLKRVFLKDDKISAIVCLNTCGVLYDEETEYSEWDLSGDNLETILRFCKDKKD